MFVSGFLVESTSLTVEISKNNVVPDVSKRQALESA